MHDSKKRAERILLIGWDAADWEVIDQLFAQGSMPVLRSLVARGVRANLRTLEPKLSPLLWTSIATGKSADKHGVLNFVEPKPDGDGLRVVQSTSRRTKAIWNILSQQGLRSNVVGWYASHPAEPINGQVVSNLLQEAEPVSATEHWPIVDGVVHPVELAGRIAASRHRSAEFPAELLNDMIPPAMATNQSLIGHARKLMAYAASVEAAATTTMTSGDWDLTMVFFDAIDTMGHHFMQYRPPRMHHVSTREVEAYGCVMDRVYEWHDASLGRLLAHAGQDTTVILVSDHGFHSAGGRPNLKGLPPEQRMELEASWHRPYGILAASGPAIIGGAECGPCSLLDITPTVLALLGSPIGEDMSGRPLEEIMAFGQGAARVESWDNLDGASGLHPKDLRQDPLDTHAAITQLVDLGYLALPKDKQAQVDLVSRESRFNLAVTLVSRNLHEEAIPILQALTREKPDVVRYRSNLVHSLATVGKLEGALKEARELYRREKGNPEVVLLIAQVSAMTGDSQEGQMLAEKARRLSKGRPDLNLPLSALEMLLGSFDSAARYAERALADDRGNLQALLALARARLASGSFEEAAGAALDALEITQALPEAHHLLGIALAWIGDLGSAKESFEMALRFAPSAQESRRFCEVLASRLGDEPRRVEYEQSRLEGGGPSIFPYPYGFDDFLARTG